MKSSSEATVSGLTEHKRKITFLTEVAVIQPNLILTIRYGYRASHGQMVTR